MPNWGNGASGAASGAAVGSSFGPWGTAIGGTIGGLAGLFGSNPSANALVPKDMQGLRAQQIQLLMSLLSPGAFDNGGAGTNFFYGPGGDRASALLAGPTPETTTYNTARPILEGMLTGTGPQFERDIGAANSQGGRFGSANAILRGEALRNLFNMRTQTANTLGMLSGQAGASTFDRAFQVQNQHAQLLAGLLGMGGQATLSNPIQQGRTPFDNFGDLAKLIATMKGTKGVDPSVGNAKMPATPGAVRWNQPWLNG